MAQETNVSNIDEIKEAMDDYLSKSADYIESSNQIKQELQNPKSNKPSLTVSELQMHSVTTTIANTLNTDAKTKRFYQFLFIAIMIASLSIILALIFHFFELKRAHAHHKAYYNYLHKAAEIKQQNTSKSVMCACNTAIQHFHIISLYRSANIELRNLKTDMKELQKNAIGNKAKQFNKKAELILMCEVEMTLMLSAIKREYFEYERIMSMQESNKLRNDAYYEYLRRAIKIKEEFPKTEIIQVCHAAINDGNIVSMYKLAKIDVSNLIIDINALAKIINTNHLHNTPLNEKQQLIIMCQMELKLMTEAIESGIQQSQNEKTNHIQATQNKEH